VETEARKEEKMTLRVIALTVLSNAKAGKKRVMDHTVHLKEQLEPSSNFCGACYAFFWLWRGIYAYLYAAKNCRTVKFST
jgi:hypothetical protein